MKSWVFGSVLLLFTGCASQEYEPFAHASRNLTTAEISSLPADVTFEEIKPRLNYFARSAVTIPVISFTIHDAAELDCVMYFENDGRLKWAWTEQSESGPATARFLWPPALAGKEVSQVFSAADPGRRTSR